MAQQSASTKARGYVGQGVHYVIGCAVEALLLALAVNLLYAVGWSGLLSMVKIHGAAKAGIVGGATVASSIVMWLMFTLSLLLVLWMLWRAWSSRFWRALAWMAGVAGVLAAIFSVATNWVLVKAGTKLITWALSWAPKHYTTDVVKVHRVLSHGVSIAVFFGLGLALLLVLVVQWGIVRLIRNHRTLAATTE